MSTQIIRNLAGNWLANNPILSAGGPGIESDTGQFKIGDGQTGWNGLDYAAIGSTSPRKLWRFGRGAPNNSTGQDGDQYLDEDTGAIYQRAAGLYVADPRYTAPAVQTTGVAITGADGSQVQLTSVAGKLVIQGITLLLALFLAVGVQAGTNTPVRVLTTDDLVAVTNSYTIYTTNVVTLWITNAVTIATTNAVTLSITNSITLDPTNVFQWSAAPAATNDPGVIGAGAWEPNYFYLCVGTNQWRRIPLANW